MAGGEGSRLRPLTSRRPKPLVPVAGVPILEHVLRLLRDHGIREVVVTVRYLGAEIRNRFGDGEDLGMRLEYAVEEEPLGTAGGVANARHLLPADEPFLVLSGDALTDIDLSWVLAEHRRREAAATLVLASVPNPLEYGLVVTDDEGRVRRFLEKPSWGEVFSDHANTGIYVVEPEVLARIPPGTVADWSQDVFPAMLRDGAPLFGVLAAGYWCDVGTISSYLQANWDALEGRVRCFVPGRRSQGSVWLGEGVSLAPDVRIEGPALVGDEAVIKSGAFVNGPAVVDRHVVVDAHAKISTSVIWPHSYIGESTRLRQSIVCRDVTIKNNCLLEEGTVVGDGCVIGQGSHLHPDVKLWPNKEVQPGSSVQESIIWAGEWRTSLFTSSGLRGLINVELTPEFSARLGAAFAASLPKGRIIAVTRDAARSSRMIKRALIGGLVGGGARVRDLSELPVPLTQFAVRRHGDVAAGVHVLVAPLDPRSAEIRFYDADGLQLDRRGERRLENLLVREDFRRVAPEEIGGLEYADPLRDYVETLLARTDVEAVRKAELRVLVDYDYSAASLVLPILLDRLGVTAIPLHAGFSEELRPRPPERWRSGVEEAALVARTLAADVGCCLGASGERLELIDETGRVLDDHAAVACLAILALADRSGGRAADGGGDAATTVVVPAAAPHWLAAAVAPHGGVVRSAKQDPASLMRAAMQPRTLLAADLDGGVIWPGHLGAFDAMATVVRLLELVAHTGRRLGEVRQQLPTGAYVRRSEFCPWELKGRVMRVVLDAHRGARLDLADGIKVLRDDGYVLVLPDADAPYFHVIASVDDEAAAHSLVDEYVGLVRSAQATDGGRPRFSVVDKG